MIGYNVVVDLVVDCVCYVAFVGLIVVGYAGLC